MKKIISVFVILLVLGVSHSQEKEKRIKFNKGTLKICSNSHMTIKGYDGDEVVIKSLNKEVRFSYFYNFKDKDGFTIKATDSTLAKSYQLLTTQDKERELEKGLKPLGNKSTNPEDNLFLDITQNPGELIIKDYANNRIKSDKAFGYTESPTGKSKKSSQMKLRQANDLVYFSSANNKYEILIPNSIKLSWNVEGCTKKNSNTFFIRTDSNPWELSDFKGDVEISTTYKSIELTNVSGPVIANTIGGNIKVVFDAISPSKLYSLVSNDGYIDITLPDDADIKVDARGDRILSNIDFKILNETIEEGTKGMELQLNSGKTKLKLDAGSGNVYLRKQE